MKGSEYVLLLQIRTKPQAMMATCNGNGNGNDNDEPPDPRTATTMATGIMATAT